MLRFTLIFSSVALLLTGCHKKTAAEIREEDRNKLRDDKRKSAVKLYQRLADEYPDSENAKKAADRAKALEAQAPKP